jgi:sugar phosphate isomerase/epimerase
MKNGYRHLVIDADDTLWENNVYFEHAFVRFAEFLDHSTLTPEEVRLKLDDIEHVNRQIHGYGARQFGRNMQECYQKLCERAEKEGIRAVLEFLPITEVKTLADARAIVEAVDHPAGGLLIDPLHLARSGGRPADLAAVDPKWFPYAQFCDGRSELPEMSFERILEDAVDGRDVAGKGDLPLQELLAALPAATPLSMEIRSKAWRDRHPDVFARAAGMYTETMKWFEAHDRA